VKEPTTISLIGMPGSGKSTVGVILAKRLGLRFVDSDLDIQRRERATLQTIVERDGYLQLRAIEERVLLDIDLGQAVVATGGSAVYSDAIMMRLQKAGPLVYLEAGIAVLQQRIAAAPPRGIASDSQQGFAEIFAERTPLYAKFASITVATDGQSAEAVANAITSLIHDLK
jgi:shikimate kinase